MLIAFIILLVLALLYLFCLHGRTGYPGLKPLQGWHYAHRGLHDETRPENSIAAFRAALEHGYGIELDIHLLRDGGLGVLHDASLLRTAGVDIKIEDLTTEELANYHLGGTEETIPTFRQVLDLFAGKAPLIIELKADDNVEALVDAAVKAMEGYEGAYCMESFDPRCILVLRKKYPHIIRGQLTRDFFHSSQSLPSPLKWMLKHQVMNFATMPDFVAYKYQDLNTISNTLVRKFWGVQGVAWTLKTKEDYDDAVAKGWLPIFEGFKP